MPRFEQALAAIPMHETPGRPRVAAQTIPGGQACVGPHGTVTVHRDLENMTLVIYAEIDPHPDDWKIAMQMADACVEPGAFLRSVERYEPGVNCIIVHMDFNSPMGIVTRSLALW